MSIQKIKKCNHLDLKKLSDNLFKKNNNNNNNNNQNNYSMIKINNKTMKIIKNEYDE